jgi:hypothetical protein
MVFNTTFNNISGISWRSVLLVEETEVPGENSLTCQKSLKNFTMEYLWMNRMKAVSNGKDAFGIFHRVNFT